MGPSQPTEDATMMQVSILDALKELDSEGGWDHEKSNGWPHPPMFSALRLGCEMGYVEEITAYGALCWRLTDEGIKIRKLFENAVPKDLANALRQWIENESQTNSVHLRMVASRYLSDKKGFVHYGF